MCGGALVIVQATLLVLGGVGWVTDVGWHTARIDTLGLGVFHRPRGVEQEDQREVKIDQMLVKVDQTGVVYVNEEVADTDPGDRNLPNLTERLSRYSASAEVANTETQVIIDCDPEAVGQRFIDVLNVCAKANIKNVSLAN